MPSVATHILIALLAVGVAFTVFQTHVFDRKILQDIAKDAISKHNTTEGVVRAVIQSLQQRYPDHVAPGQYEDLEWLFNNAGGAMGSMTVLHASISEYIIIFGTALG